jgi:GT2 family glycosyltransferase
VKPKVSVVIPHYGALELLRACLRALQEHTPQTLFELIIVDNGMGLSLPGGQVIRNRTNRGFAVACNQGASVANAERVLFLNNDTEVRAGWLQPMLDALESDVAAVGSLLVHLDGSIAHGGIRFYRDAQDVLVAENIHHEGRRRDVEAVTGACMLVDRTKFWAMGGFDAGYRNGYEDVDLCLAFRQIGWRIVYEPASVVMHRESASGKDRWAYVSENIARLQAKWGEVACAS